MDLFILIYIYIYIYRKREGEVRELDKEIKPNCINKSRKNTISTFVGFYQ